MFLFIILFADIENIHKGEKQDFHEKKQQLSLHVHEHLEKNEKIMKDLYNFGHSFQKVETQI